MKYYAVIFDRKDSMTYTKSPFVPTPGFPYIYKSFDYKGFHDDFIKPQEIRKWWHYMESLYIIGTDWSSQTLSEHFTKTAQAHGIPNTHIVLEVNLRSRFGWLPKDAWDWIDKEAANSPLLTSLMPPKTQT